MQTLPNEILISIIQQLSPSSPRYIKTLRSLRLVNKFTSEVASDVLYSTFTLRTSLESATVKSSFYTNHSRLSQYVRELEINISSFIPRDDLARMSIECEGSYSCEDGEAVVRDEVYEYPGREEIRLFKDMMKGVMGWIMASGRRFSLVLRTDGEMDARPFRNSRWDELFFKIVDGSLTERVVRMVERLCVVAVEPRDLNYLGKSGILSSVPDLSIKYSSAYHRPESSLTNSNHLQDLLHSLSPSPTRTNLCISGNCNISPVNLPTYHSPALTSLSLSELLISAESLHSFLSQTGNLRRITLRVIQLDTIDITWSHIFNLLNNTGMITFRFEGLCYHDEYPTFMKKPRTWLRGVKGLLLPSYRKGDRGAFEEFRRGVVGRRLREGFGWDGMGMEREEERVWSVEEMWLEMAEREAKRWREVDDEVGGWW